MEIEASSQGGKQLRRPQIIAETDLSCRRLQPTADWGPSHRIRPLNGCSRLGVLGLSMSSSAGILRVSGLLPSGTMAYQEGGSVTSGE